MTNFTSEEVAKGCMSMLNTMYSWNLFKENSLFRQILRTIETPELRKTSVLRTNSVVMFLIREVPLQAVNQKRL